MDESGWKTYKTPFCAWLGSGHGQKWGFHSHGGSRKCLAYQGKSQSQMDEDWGYPYDSGNYQVFETAQKILEIGLKSEIPVTNEPT